jgi:hypothetical protein
MNHKTASLSILAVALWLFGLPSPIYASPLYLVEESLGAGFDILLKFDAGVLTPVGTIGFDQVRGLAYDATTDTLFGVSRGDYGPKVPFLITIDRNTGVGTKVGATPYLPPGSNAAAISVNAAGTIFGLGHLNDLTKVDTLLLVDKASGVAMPINPGGLGITFSGLAFDHASGILYSTTIEGQLYTVDPNSGIATLVGQITGTNGGAARIAFDQETGILYGITELNQLVTINLETLAATQVAQFATPGQIYSLDFISQASNVVPEPGSLGLLGLGTFGLIGFSRWRKHRR